MRCLAAARPGWPGRAPVRAGEHADRRADLALFFGLFGSAVAVIYGVGLLLVLLVLATIRGFGGIERRLARTLLGVDIPAGERVRDQHGVVVKVRRLVLAPIPGGRSAGWARGC